MNFVYVKAGKLESEESKRHLEDVGQKCRFGFNWWFWLPRFNFRIFTSYKAIECMWFCFAISYEG
jgi:hypothetical protein